MVSCPGRAGRTARAGPRTALARGPPWQDSNLRHTVLGNRCSIHLSYRELIAHGIVEIAPASAPHLYGVTVVVISHGNRVYQHIPIGRDIGGYCGVRVNRPTPWLRCYNKQPP